MANHQKQNLSPLVSFVIFPLLIVLVLILLYLFLVQCLGGTKVYQELSEQSSILGVSSFDLTSSSTDVLDNDTVNFVLSLTSDNANSEVLDSSVVFNLEGEGRIVDNIIGPGICVLSTELRVICTSVNILPSETLTWIVPVTAKDTCSASASPTLTMIATYAAIGSAPEASEDTTIVTCIDPTPDDEGETTVVPLSGEVETETSSASEGLTSNDILAIVNLHNEQVMQCYVNKTFGLTIALITLLIIALLGYFGMRREKDYSKEGM